MEDDIKKALEKNPLITMYSDVDGNIVGWKVALDAAQLNKHIKEEVMVGIGVSEETMKFFENTTEEQRAEITRLSQIAYHQKELQRLQMQSESQF